MHEDDLIYIAVKPCGCVVGTLALNAPCSRHDSKIIAGWLREGLNIEKKTVAWVREHGFQKCAMHAGQPQQQCMFGNGRQKEKS